MKRPLSALSALTFSSITLVIAHAPQSKAMAIAFDCFDRTTSQLVARSAVDMTSPAVSCLPVPGGTVASNPDWPSDDNVLEISDTISEDDPDADFFEDSVVDDSTADDFEDDVADLEDSQSTGEKLGSAVGEHLGKILVEGLSDLFR